MFNICLLTKGINKKTVKNKSAPDSYFVPPATFNEEKQHDFNILKTTSRKVAIYYPKKEKCKIVVKNKPVRYCFVSNRPFVREILSFLGLNQSRYCELVCVVASLVSC